MLNLTPSRPRATDTGARVRAIDDLRRYADRVAAAKLRGEPVPQRARDAGTDPSCGRTMRST